MKTKLVRLSQDIIDELDKLRIKKKFNDKPLSYNLVIREILSDRKEYRWFMWWNEFYFHPYSITRELAVEKLLINLDCYWKKHYAYGGKKHPLDRK